VLRGRAPVSLPLGGKAQLKLSEHADHSEGLVGIRGEDIHRWIDGLFDAEGFDQLLRSGRSPDYDPYAHRKFRHCVEAIDDAIEQFAGSYTPEQVRTVFECHLQADYDGYLPSREDFVNGTFTEKYHENEQQAASDRILSPDELSEYFKGKTYSRQRARATKDRSFRLRVVLPTAAAILLFVTSVFVFVIPVFRGSMLDNKKEMIRQLTAAAASIVTDSIEKQRAGELDLAQAKQLAAEKIAAMRYGAEGKDYFWITDMQPKMVMHPYRLDLVGKDLSNYSDTKGERGKRLFVEFVRIVRAEGSGYLEYMWQWKDDAQRMEPKLSYVRGIPAWGWIIGTGVYIHDVDQEIDRLTRNLIIICAVISLLLVLILASVVWQSRRLEAERVQAEAGLHEAKERYRALVEASKEGYILVVGGEIIYSNRTLQQLLGMSEDELASAALSQLLAADIADNEPARRELDAVARGAVASSSFEAQLSTKDGESVDVIVNVSKIFFSQKNGHVVSFRPVKRTRVRSLLETIVGGSGQQRDQSELLERLRGATSKAQVVQTLNRLSLLLRDLAEQGVRPAALRDLIGQAFSASTSTMGRLALAEVGPPPVPYAFFSVGSNSRHEMTMFSDQDNALVFADVPAADKDAATRYFLKLADRVCSSLNEAGYPFCPGGIMAVNPKWCLPSRDWRRCIDSWVNEPKPEAILDLHVFSDISSAFGEASLADQVAKHLRSRAANTPAFLLQFARNSMLYKVPVDVVAKAKAGRRGETIDLKECLKPLEIFARLYALKHEIDEPSTIGRLRALEAAEVLESSLVDEATYVFDYLWRMRFYNQLMSHVELRQVNDTLDVALLTAVERENLKNVLTQIVALQDRLCRDFLGVSRQMVNAE
jgi:CBS domain-containing protein